MKPLFVTGFIRSGTTLLVSLLDGHPDLCIFPRETQFFMYARAELEQDLEDGLEKFIKRTWQQPQFALENPLPPPFDINEYYQRLKKNWGVDNFAMSSFIRSAVFTYAELMNQTDCHWWIEKTPTTEQHAYTLKQWYSDLRMIYIVRDPRAVCASVKAWQIRKGCKHQPLWVAANWNKSVYYGSNLAKICPSLIVRYEDLLSQPTKTMKAVAEFLGIEFLDELVHPTMNTQSWSSNSSYMGSSEGIQANSANKWREQLTPVEVQQIERFCRQNMQAYGYSDFSDTKDNCKQELVKWSVEYYLRRLADQTWTKPTVDMLRPIYQTFQYANRK